MMRKLERQTRVIIEVLAFILICGRELYISSSLKRSQETQSTSSVSCSRRIDVLEASEFQNLSSNSDLSDVALWEGSARSKT